MASIPAAMLRDGATTGLPTLSLVALNPVMTEFQNAAASTKVWRSISDISPPEKSRLM